MWSRSLPSLVSSLLRPLPTSSSAMSTGFRNPPSGSNSPWILTVPELRPNKHSTDLLPFKRQIPMAVRYNIPTTIPLKERLPAYTPPAEPEMPIMTPNGTTTLGSVPTPTEDRYGSVKDPGVDSTTLKYNMRNSRQHINKGRPRPQILQRIRRKRRRQTLIWEKYKIQRRHEIDRVTARFYTDEKKRIDSADWWDWYITYDNPPKQF